MADEAYPSLAEVLRIFARRESPPSELQTEVAILQLYNALASILRLCREPNEFPPDILAQKLTAAGSIVDTLVHATAEVGWDSLGIAIVEVLVLMEDDANLSELDDEFAEIEFHSGPDAAVRFLEQLTATIDKKYGPQLKQLMARLRAHRYYYHPRGKFSMVPPAPADGEWSREMSRSEAGKIYFRGRVQSSRKKMADLINEKKLTTIETSANKLRFLISEWPEDLRDEIKV
jgi:hypothetical protein